MSPRPVPSRPGKYDVGLRAERAEVPLNGGDAAILWAIYSPFPAEAGIAGRRYKQFAPLYTDSWALLMAVCEAAFEGHHAAGSCRGDYLRSRAARIREVVYAEQKQDMSTPRFTPGMRPLTDILAKAFTLSSPAVPVVEGNDGNANLTNGRHHA